MDIGGSTKGADRARWLAELAVAVEQAETLAAGLALSAAHGPEAGRLRSRLQAIKREIEDLRCGGWRAPVQELGSKWIGLSAG